MSDVATQTEPVVVGIVPKKVVKAHYVDNKDYTAKLTVWTDRQRELKEQDLPQEQLPEDLAICVMNICTNIGRRPNFINYSFCDDMILDAIENCIKYISNFNGHKFKNAFGYTSQLAYRTFQRRIKREKHICNKHLKFIKNLVDVDQLSAVVAGASDIERQHYNSYLDGLKVVIDDVGKIPEEMDKIEKKIDSEDSVLLSLMQQGEDL